MSRTTARKTLPLGGLLSDALQALPAVRTALDAPPAERAEIGGLWSSSAALALGLLARGRGRVVALASDPEVAEGLALDLGTLHPDLPVALLPAEEEGLPEGPEMRANRSERLVALATLRAEGDGVLVVPAAATLQALPSEGGELVTLVRGGTIHRDRLVDRLLNAGFDRVPMVAAPGEVSVRGDIIDVYPWAHPHPLRVELIDDEIEDLRRFEVDSQTSVEVLEQIDFAMGDPRGTTDRLDERLAALGSDRSRPFPVFLIDPPAVSDRLAEAAFLHDIAPKTVGHVLTRLRSGPGGELFSLDLGKAGLDASIRSVSAGQQTVAAAVTAWRGEGRTVVLLCETSAEAERLAETLAHAGLDTSPELRVETGRLTKGFAFPDGGPVVIHHHELIGRRAVRRRRPQRIVVSRAIDSLGELQPGDYVVHLSHGVALYRGMRRLDREQGEEDFLVLEFAEETTLFVPASRIDLVERFIGGGGEGPTPQLDRIGGKSWKRKKDKVARAVEDVASQLLSLQTARRTGEGFAFPADDPLQGRFEAAFPHDDTPDQSTSWSEVRRDMEGRRPMDRLLVGDVGFGKTEVAVRAAYKSVLAGKQVAILVPTTILAEQHFDTFCARMADEPVRIEALSRLRTAGSAATLADLAEGRVDVLIGTHRLLGKDVKFSDLGLVIVDEEQRFGVTHKERLKQLRTTVDVLTLSATPIPRTLHMAMSGLRDISTIRTPPLGRRPVITRVAYETDEALRDALRHEVGRGGQVFVLHNRVQTIGRMLERVRSLAPTARAAFAHGQMGARELQGIVEDFAAGELDVLVCTTIIESGIDIPRANTIVVTDAHRFGLADMHQLRGRVGRESRQAYAHFLIPKDQPLPDQAKQRLKAIEEFTSLGSGLPIALRDLELRGAGNLLGAEQSGHILAVGYDMYCRLLKAAVARAKGSRIEDEPGEIEVELGVSAFLPAEYVTDDVQRMALLRRLAASGQRRLDGIAKELADRYGRLPEPAARLVDLFRLRARVRTAGLISVLADGLGGAILTVGSAETFEERSPFEHRELAPVTPGRFRVQWPEEVQTPAARLRYLLDRFTPRSKRRR